MVLCLKTRESRSLPGLPRTKPLYISDSNKRDAFLIETSRFCLSPRLAVEAGFDGHE